MMANNNYVRLSLKPDEAYFLLSFLDNQNLTRKEWQASDSIRSKLYRAVNKWEANRVPKVNRKTLPHSAIYSDGVMSIAYDNGNLNDGDITISE